MRGHLGPEELPLCGTNGGRTAGMPFGLEGAGPCALPDIPLDGRDPDPKRPGSLHFGHAIIDCGQDLGAQIGGICFHSPVCQIVQ
jgi:hypothetical protein